jgi:hypothetical protein
MQSVSLRLINLFSVKSARLLPAGLAAAAFAFALPAAAQYPGQVSDTGNGPELRSVAVLEWTGDEQHPKASRIIPVSVFDGHALQDGGIYLTQPEPLALQSDVEYQLKDDGKNVGFYIIQNAALEQGSWVGHGAFKQLPKPKPAAPAAAAWKDDEDVASDEPVLHRKTHPGESSGSGSGSGSGSASQGPPPDPDRPTLHRSDDAGSGSSGTGDSASQPSGPPPDPDRPTLHKAPDSSSGNNSGGNGNPAPTEPDRPKLQPKTQDDDSYVSSSAGAADPDRPQLIRGQSSYAGPEVLPTFVGVPADMEQSVAVSDSKNTPEHLWSYSWANPADEAKYKSQLEDIARTALGLTPPAKPAPARPVKKAASQKSRLALPPPPPPLVDEQFRVFELAYGAGATLVLSAHTGGSGADQKFVTLIAQPDLYGNVAVLVKNVTDGAHLDVNPRLRLIDPVDAMADNRGELLFELRGATERQFALYRVLRGQASQVFVSGGRDLAPTAN